MNKLRFLIGAILSPLVIVQVDTLLRWPIIGQYRPISFNLSAPTSISAFVFIFAVLFFIFYFVIFALLGLLTRYTFKTKRLSFISLISVVSGFLLGFPIISLGSKDFGSLLFSGSYYLILFSLSYFFIVVLDKKYLAVKSSLLLDLSGIFIVLQILLFAINHRYFSDERNIVLEEVKEECVIYGTPLELCSSFHWGFKVPKIEKSYSNVFFMWPGRAQCMQGDNALVGRYGTLEKRLDSAPLPFNLVQCKNTYNKAKQQGPLAGTR